MSMLNQFVNRTEFSSYEDLRDHLEIRVPDNFNFAYDVVDATAQAEPGRRAMVWCNDDGEGKVITFADLKKGSDRAAQVLQACECDARGRLGFEDAAYPQAERLQRALDAALQVRTDTVAADAAARGLKGARIGEAVHQARSQAVARAFPPA